MSLAVAIVAYLAGHFLAYCGWFRHRPACRTERGIFLLHAVSFVLCVAAAGVVGLRLGVFLPGTVLAAALHGIYSLSFLEIWSLTQISYSLLILRTLRDAGGPAGVAQLTGMQAVGDRKQAGRSEDLGRLGLKRPDGSATWLGGVVSAALRFVLWLTRGQPTN